MNASWETNNLETLTVGAYLRQLREQQGKSLEAVAREIDRRVEDLARIEADDFTSLVRESAAVYVQGAIRNLASHLQVPRKDMDTLLKRFHAQISSQDVAPSLVITEANVASQNKSFRRGHFMPLMRIVVPLLVFSLAASQVMSTDSWVLRKIRETFPSSGQGSANTTQDIVLNQEPSREVQNDGESLVLNINPVRLESAPAEAQSALPSSTAITTTLSLESTAPSSETSPAPSVESALPVPSLSLESTRDMPTTALVNPEATASTKTSDTAALTNAPMNVPMNAPIKIEVLNEVWFEISNAQKKRVHTGTFKKGTVLELAADGAPYQLSVGKPSALKLEMAGQAKDLKALLVRGTKNQYRLNVE